MSKFNRKSDASRKQTKARTPDPAAAFYAAIHMLCTQSYIPPHELSSMMIAINSLWYLHEDFVSKQYLPALTEDDYGDDGFDDDDSDSGYYRGSYKRKSNNRSYSRSYNRSYKDSYDDSYKKPYRGRGGNKSSY